MQDNTAEKANIVNMGKKVILGLNYDPTIWIATGESRFSTSWKNKKIRWAELLARLRPDKATMTQETQAEYLKLPKSKQDDIKDVGGFVGGTLKSGRRKTDTVEKRTLLTFDLDFAPPDFIETMQLEAPYAWAIYSTHKHKPDAPRMRLIAPLDREVSPEEYEAIMRKVAEGIGLKYFDSTTFQPARLMYWPSYSRDGEYIFEYNDDKPICADKVLAEYPDWTDISYWPICPDEVRIEKKRADKQQDPTKKEGLVGVFCRTYTVPEAIAEFLPDVYHKDDGKEDRYTYTEGSTSGGLVIYDDGLFCYSNHSTDPAHGMDLNAFDLVRIHKFGALDENAKEDTPINRRPSYKAMTELILEDINCIKTSDEERLAKAIEDFDGEEADSSNETTEKAKNPKDWKIKVLKWEKYKDALRIAPTVENLLKIFEYDDYLKGIRLNELSGFIEITTPVPWRKELSEWKGEDDSCLYVYLATHYYPFQRNDINDTLVKVAKERGFNPIKEYLKGLPEWDGISRIETLFIDYLGAEDNEYTREVTKRWMIAAVSRILRPGCKFDYVPVLSGPGGIGKSTLIAKIGGKWFSDSLSFEDMKDKTAAEKIQGTWINEISELKGMRKTELESIKGFISRTDDRYRPSYGKRPENHKRTCVFIGTSNAEDYLKDTTGNRRFWPIDCSGIHTKNAWNLTDEDVDRLWEEVIYYYYNLDDTSLVLSAELEKVAIEMQTRALEHDERLGLVAAYLDRKLPADWSTKSLEDRRDWLGWDGDTDGGSVERDCVTVMEIWAECFRKNPADKRRSDSDDITRILLQLGWKREGRHVKKFPIYGRQGYYIRAVNSD